MTTPHLARRRLRLARLVLGLFLSACAGGSDAGPPVDQSEGKLTVTDQHPGAAVYDAALADRLARALAAKGPGYEPRTHHLRADGAPQFTNRLILEDSPYLLQHAHNPVDWYPWGPEAFARAVQEDKPIFLSIGYSTCHWCHVMERESFEDVEIARLMNQWFVCVKLDREQRPDVDDLYMTAVQLLTGQGGWPMSSFLTTAGKPFHGGTYFPPPAFAALLSRVHDAWGQQRQELERSAERLTEAVRQVTSARGKAQEVGEEVLAVGAEQILRRHDARHGGFGSAPKFPHEPELLFLLDHVLRHGDARARDAVTSTLDAMARGGIYDQVGGGFHRYSTDSRWLVPHFEKMLYNQAHLSRVYLAAWQLTGEPLYARVARQTLDYVLREMTSPDGGFYSATDADSEGEEGAFFVWTPAELRAALPSEDAALALDVWGVSEDGNFEGKSILYLPRPLDEVAASRNVPLDELLARLDAIRETLWQAREGREHPLRDDKVLTEWNGMMITAFAAGAEILGEERYLTAAKRAAELVWRVNRRAEGELWRVHLAGSSSVPALQSDYAYLAEALVSLYDATGEAVWLERAREVADAMVERFWDGDGGGFYLSAEGVDPHLIGRPKSPTDGATPSGNSVAVRALTLLAGRTDRDDYRDRAHATVGAFAALMTEQPVAFAYTLLGIGELLHGAAGPRQYTATGVVRAHARLAPGGGADEHRLVVALKVRDGWHVNAHAPRQGDLIPTDLGVAEGRGSWQLVDEAYPEPDVVQLAFQDDPLAVYQGEVELRATLRGEPLAEEREAPVVPVKLRVQACNDHVCLRPEEIVLEVPIRG